MVTILLMLINLSGKTHEKTPSSDTFSMIDLWLLICIIFVALALLEYGFVIRINFNGRGSATPVLNSNNLQQSVVNNRRKWTKVCMSHILGVPMIASKYSLILFNTL